MPRRGGVKIPVRLGSEEAKQDARELTRDLREGFTPVIDVVDGLRAGIDLMVGSLQMAVGTMKELLELSIEEDKQQRRFLGSMRLRGEFTKQQFEDLQRFNAAIQQQTGVADQQLLQIQSIAGTMGVHADQLEMVTKAVLAFQDFDDSEINEATKTIGQLYKGDVEALEDYRIKINSVTEGFEFLLKLFDKTVKLQSFGVEVKRLTANWDDFKTSLGDAVVQNDDAMKLLQDLNKWILELTEKLKENGPETREFISGMVSDLRSLGSFLKSHTDEMKMLAVVLLAAKGAKISHMMLAPLAGLVGKGTLAGFASFAGSAAGAATGGLMGMLATLGIAPSTADVGGRDKLAQGILQGIPGQEGKNLAVEQAGGLFTKNTPRFRNTAFAGQGADADIAFAEFEGIKVDLPNADLLEKQKKARAARKAATEKLLDELIEQTELEFAAEAEAQRKREELQQETLIAETEFREALAAARMESFDQLLREENRIIEEENALAILGLQNAELNEQQRTDVLALGIRTRQDLARKEHELLRDAWNDMKALSINASVDFISGSIGAVIAGEADMKQAVARFFGTMLSGLGDMMIAAGTAALVGAQASIWIPVLKGIFGGVPGTAAAAALIAAGAGLKGVGIGVSSLGSRGAGGGTVSAPRATSSFDGGEDFGIGPGLQQRNSAPTLGPARQTTIVNVSIDGSQGLIVGDSIEVARWLKDLLDENDALSPV